MRRDPHSYADEAQGVVEHLTWDVEVDFMTRTLRCTAELRVRGAGETLDLDTRDLAIERVDDGGDGGGDGGGKELAWELADAEPIFGARLRVQVHGANGYSHEHPVARFSRTCKGAVNYEGTREIHKVMQADYLLGYRADRPTRCELPAYADKVKS